MKLDELLSWSRILHRTCKLQSVCSIEMLRDNEDALLREMYLFNAWLPNSHPEIVKYTFSSDIDRYKTYGLRNFPDKQNMFSELCCSAGDALSQIPDSFFPDLLTEKGHNSASPLQEIQ